MKIRLTICTILMCTTILAQNFKEVQLPEPDRLSPFFIGPLFNSAIHYGAIPTNFNNKVLVFNHGYIGLNQTPFILNNTLYDEAYDAGYQIVFVATTRGGGLWVNGELLAEAIDIITEKLNVSQVDLIVHSNGGKAAEAAMFANDKRDQVGRVFALGAPFRGTYLADISQMPWLRWAWNLTGLNDGAFTSTTYYCDDVVRPFFDNSPLNQPNKFVVLAASGYENGTNFLTAGAFKLTGSIVYDKQGTNDGVSPYSSTLRPGAELVFEENDPRADVNHLDIAFGQFNWPFIKSYLDNPQLTSGITPSQQKSTNDIVVESNYYIVHSENTYETISFDKNADYALAEVLHEDQYANFSSYEPQNKTRKQQKNAASKTEYFSQIPLYRSEVGTDTRLESDSKFVAFVKQNTNLTMSLGIAKNQEHPLLKVQLKEKGQILENIADINVHGVIIKNNQESSIEVIEFSQKENTFIFDTTALTDGIYSLMLQSEKEGDFKRSLISGFVVGAPETVLATTSPIDAQANGTNNKAVVLTPTVITNQAELSFNSISSKKDMTIGIYDITGKKVKQFIINTQKSQNHAIGNKLSGLKSGLYLLKAEGNNTIKFLKK